MKHRYKKCLEHSFSFATISFDHFFASLSRAKRLLSNLGAVLKNEESVAGFAKETQRRNTRDTSLFKKNERERERAHLLPPVSTDSLYSTRSIGLVIFIWRQYSRRCTGISSFVPVIKLEISRFAGQRLRDSGETAGLFPLIPLPPNLAESRSNEERRRGGLVEVVKGGQRWRMDMPLCRIISTEAKNLILRFR